jgi:signal transduction histidine kinase
MGQGRHRQQAGICTFRHLRSVGRLSWRVLSLAAVWLAVALGAATALAADAPASPSDRPPPSVGAAPAERLPDLIAEQALLIDTTDHLTVDQMDGQAFSVVEGGNIFFGYQKHPVWIRIRTLAPREASSYWLSAWPPAIHSATLFQRGADGNWQETSLGIRYAHSRQPAPTLGLVFPLQLPPNAEATVYLRLMAHTPTAKLAVAPLVQIMETERAVAITYATYFGFVFFAFCVSVLAFYITRLKLWLITAAYDVVAMAQLSIVSGFAASYLAPDAAGLLSKLHPPSNALLLFAASHVLAHVAVVLNASAWVYRGFVISRVLPLLGLVLMAAGLDNMAMTLVTTAAVGLALWSCTLVFAKTRFDAVTVGIIRALLAIAAIYTVFFLGPWVKLRPAGFDFLQFAAVIPVNLNATAMAMLIAFRLSLIQARDKARLERETLELERRRADALAQAQSKSAFLAYMSHEIRTPLNVVVGLAELANSRSISTEQREHYLAMLTESAGALTSVVSDVLDFSKMEVGKLEIHPVDFSLEEMTGSLRNTYAALAQRKGLTFSIDHDDASPGLVHGDCIRLRQILDNYLSNAFKFTEQGSVTLSITRPDRNERHRFEVRDTGRGLAADEQAKLFLAYSQSGDDKLTKARGTGLGLAICRELAQLMGGSVGVTSQRGEGSCFWLEVPLKLAGTPPAYAPVAREGASPFEGRHVLVVEDDATSRAVLADLLSREGAMAVAVADGDLAVEAIRQAQASGHPVDLVFLDIHLQHADGMQVVRRIRALGDAGQLPVVALTGSVITDELQEALRAGMNDIVSKPVRLTRLREVARKFCGNSGD